MNSPDGGLGAPAQPWASRVPLPPNNSCS